MNVVGYRNRWKDVEQGTFFCPVCGGDRYYTHRQERRAFSALMLPMGRSEVVDEAYECQSCHRVYDERVLDAATTADLATRLQWGMRLAVVLLVLDGDPHDAAVRAAAVTAVKTTAAIQYNDTQLDGDLRAIDLTQLDDALDKLAVDLEPMGKERFVRACADVAQAGGLLTAANRAALDSIARNLGLSPAQVHNLLSEILDHPNHT